MKSSFTKNSNNNKILDSHKKLVLSQQEMAMETNAVVNNVFNHEIRNTFK